MEIPIDNLRNREGLFRKLTVIFRAAQESMSSTGEQPPVCRGRTPATQAAGDGVGVCSQEIQLCE